MSSTKSVLESKVENPSKSPTKPNIVIIFADDMGFGDIQSYNTDSLVPTPNLNALASEGMKFTDAHSSSAVCTPSRYSLLTGRYAWRTALKKGVLDAESPLMIDTKRETIAGLLKKADYETIMVGKWHLGLGEGKPDYRGQLSPGPNVLGFDYFYGIPASLDMGPYVYIENEHVVTPLTGNKIAASKHRRGGGDGFWRKAEIGDGFKHQEVLPNLTKKAVSKIAEAANKEKPFFMYFSLPSPHTPWLPAKEFQGVSGAGTYGDFAANTDHVVGDVLAAIKAAGIEDNTIVIYSSDNGAHWKPNDQKKYAHRANGEWRGQKADIYEGGHRVPLIIKWPGRVETNAESAAPIVLNDIVRTMASIVGVQPGQGAATDSYDFSQVLLGQSDKFDRAPMIHHSIKGRFAIRVGDWKLVEGKGSGGFSKPANITPKKGQSPFELYNLALDPAEKNNLADKEPARVKSMLIELNDIRNHETVSF
ncbi:arylsulfatase [Psychrosphaera sp. 1_MG-2023]|uniref:sulfatase family protein n=1 Tax=Psychrosphaera sp. 1_MG-2023 TaxID=3062643 RepID=UPI0026E1C33F|nr:arylsulfatase [Psychrosphaera sp. 1_MG-2023]MDO6721362.1 arylsulfatase [Psychrosphaera sp. 1_MG-2023]